MRGTELQVGAQVLAGYAQADDIKRGSQQDSDVACPAVGHARPTPPGPPELRAPPGRVPSYPVPAFRGNEVTRNRPGGSHFTETPICRVGCYRTIPRRSAAITASDLECTCSFS